MIMFCSMLLPIGLVADAYSIINQVDLKYICSAC